MTHPDHRPTRWALAAALALCCAPSVHAEDLKGAIMAANSRFSTLYGQGDFQALATLYTPDGQVLAEGAEPVSGAGAIRALFQGLYDSGGAGVTLKTLEVYGTGSLVTEVGAYTLADRGGKEMDHGKYVVLWRKVHGHWLLHRDIFNSSVPAKK